MQLVHVYLNFPGNAEEAFNFYAKVFGTTILMKATYGEVPFIQGAPDSARNKLMHVQLPLTEAVHLMGSDSVEGMSPPFRQGNNFHVSIVGNDKAEADRLFSALSGDGGKTWGSAVVLRDDGGGRDVGYIRSVVRPDGKLVAVYYYHDRSGPDRYLAATVWDPGTR